MRMKRRRKTKRRRSRRGGNEVTDGGYWLVLLCARRLQINQCGNNGEVLMKQDAQLWIMRPTRCGFNYFSPKSALLVVGKCRGFEVIHGKKEV